jgi:dihydroneopterin aldolase/2-amino-4-hydroxy-6-hydroxymethyldihydropteridine diphosphokinase
VNDSISIVELEVMTQIGIGEEERKTKQKLLISVDMFLDTLQAGKQDDLNLSVDYSVISNKINKLAKEERRTIESFAEDIAKKILEEEAVDSVNVEVKKFIMPNTKHVSVSIKRP